MICKYFLPLHSQPFHFVVFLLLWRNISVHDSPIIYFCLSCLCFGCHIKKILTKTSVKGRSTSLLKWIPEKNRPLGLQCSWAEIASLASSREWRIVGIQSWGAGFFQGIMSHRRYSSWPWWENWHSSLNSSFVKRFAI